MVGAAHRGRTLLSSPIAFEPRVRQPFPWTVCACSVTSGFASSSCCCDCLVIVFGVNQCMSQRLFPRRPSQIFNPHVNFVLTGSGSAIALQHTILLFLTDPDTTGNLDIGRLSQVSVNCFRVTVTWRQVDTPSVASVASLPSLDFHISDDEF